MTAPAKAGLKPCGTVAAAQRHRRRGEPLCPPCRDAVKAYHAAHWQTWSKGHVRARDGGPGQHGRRRAPEREAHELEWRLRARCRTAEPTRFDPRESRATNANLDAAREFCASCPVLEACAGEADFFRSTGLWGGSWRTLSGGGQYRVRPLIPGAP